MDVEKAIEDCAENYRKNTAISVSVIKLMEEPIAAPADLDHCEQIGLRHLNEAVCYRSVDDKFWGGLLL